MQSAAKVGLLVAAFVALLFGSYAVLGKSLFAKKVHPYYAEFADANGVTAGTPVMMAGVKVGSVTKVGLETPRLARLALAVNDDITIPRGSIATISSSLIGFGESPVVIEPPAQVTEPLRPGATLVGLKRSALDNLIPNSKETVSELNKTLVSVQGLLNDQKLRGRADELLASSQKTIDQFGVLAKTANNLMLQNQGNLSQALDSATRVVQDVRQVTYKVAQLVNEGKLQGQATAILDELRATARHADQLVQSMDALVTDPKLRKPINQSAANVAQITDTGKSIASNANEITKNGIVVSRNAIALTQKANEIASKASLIEDQLQDVLGRVGGFFQHKAGPGPLTNLSTEMDLLRETRPNYWRTDISLRYPTGEGSIDGGIYDAFGTNKLTLQYEKTVSPKFDYRYGVYASKPGVGVDYALAPRLGMRGDLWDINRLRLDLRARYDFGSGVVGWVGLDSLFDRNSPAIGIGVRR